jgi:hypothetical protein
MIAGTATRPTAAGGPHGPGSGCGRDGAGGGAAPSGRARDIASLALAVLAVSLAIVHQARTALDVFDMSSFMDVGWRMACGQRLYADVQYYAGPVHPYMNAIAFRLFGFTGTALVAHVLAVDAVVMVLTFFVARRRLPLPESVVLSALSGIAFYGIIAHPWYDQSASVFLVIAAALVALTSPLPAGGVALAVGLAAGLCCALSLGAKHNIGLAGTAVLTLSLGLSARWRPARAALAIGLGAGLWALSFLVPDRIAFVEQVASFLVAHESDDHPRTILRPARRLLDGTRLFGILGLTPQGPLLVAAALLALVAPLPFRRAHAVELALALGLVAIMIFAAWTGTMRAQANFPLLGLAVTLVMSLDAARPGPRPAWRRGVLLAVLVALVAVAARAMAANAVWQWKAENIAGDHALALPGFEGWRCAREIGEPMEQAVAELSRRTRPDESLLVLPDCTMIYGLLGRPGFPGAPFTLDRGVTPPTRRLIGAFASAVRTAPPVWLLLHRRTEPDFLATEPMLEWIGIAGLVRERYLPVWDNGRFVLLRLDNRRGNAGRITPRRSAAGGGEAPHPRPAQGACDQPPATRSRARTLGTPGHPSGPSAASPRGACA